MMQASWTRDVRAFWFSEIEPAQWFKTDERLDERIRARFLGIHEEQAAAAISDLTADGPTALAAIIVLDQFPRNMFRGTPRAFATDAKALAIAETAVDRRYDTSLSKNERVFLYLPFEHSEDLSRQELSVELLSSLGDPEFARYSMAHKVIIERFGRFPHRNAILGRQSTPEEIEFLKQPMSAF
jgi:uncharacterized protein (DUF924 family)